MAMDNDDLFVREVDEELRQDRLKAIWTRFGPLLIGLAVLVVVAAAAWQGWVYYTEKQANAAGDRFLAAIDLAREGKTAEATAALGELEKTGTGDYPVLARLRAAQILETTDPAAAAKAFDAVAADTSVPEALRNIAQLRAAYLMVDIGSYDDVANRAELLSADGNALRYSAREALGLAAWKAGANEEALKWFQAIADDADSSGGIRSRAAVMLDLLAGKGVKQSG